MFRTDGTEAVAQKFIGKAAGTKADDYARQGEYTLRPGLQLALYLRRSAFGL